MMFLLALMLPVLFCMLLLGPAYAGVCVALYFYYGEEMQDHFYDPAYMIDLYGVVYYYWEENHAMLNFADFVLPVFGPFVVGVLLGMYWCFLFVRYVKNIFHI